MKTETIIERLENALGCLNGSMIDNCTPQNQFESLLNDLKQVKNNDLLHSVSVSLLPEAMEVIDDYLNAGCKESRKEASNKAKKLYEKYTGEKYNNRNER